MTTKKAVRPITLELALKSMTFEAPGWEGVKYIVYADGAEKDPARHLTTVQPRLKEATGLNLSDYNDRWRWFLVYCEDCFDPPVCITPAETAQDAIDYWIDLCDWAPRLSEKELQDMRAEDMDFYLNHVETSPDGHEYVGENIMVREIHLTSVEIA